MYSASQLVTHVRHYSVDTELIDGNDRAKNHFNVVFIDTEVCRQFLSSFAFQVSSFQNTGYTEYELFAFHWSQVSCPQRLHPIFHSICTYEFHSTSFSIRVQENVNVRVRIFVHILPHFWNSQCVILRFLFLLIQCRCTLTWRQSVLGIAQVHTKFQPSFSESRRESAMWWILEDLTTRAPSIPVNSTQFSTLGRIHTSINFLLPYAYGSIRNSSHTQYQIGEYIDFRYWQLNCSVVQQSRPFTRFFFPVDLWPNFMSLRKIVSLFFVADFWLNVNSRNKYCRGELRLAEWQS